MTLICDGDTVTPTVHNGGQRTIKRRAMRGIQRNKSPDAQDRHTISGIFCHSLLRRSGSRNPPVIYSNIDLGDDSDDHQPSWWPQQRIRTTSMGSDRMGREQNSHATCVALVRRTSFTLGAVKVALCQDADACRQEFDIASSRLHMNAANKPFDFFVTFSKRVVHGLTSTSPLQKFSCSSRIYVEISTDITQVPCVVQQGCTRR